MNRFRKFELSSKLILSVMAIGMFAFSLNIPTPVVVQKDAEQAFPCQHCPCGCENATQCWDACCCFSDAEKMNWARVNNVTPPVWFMERMATVTQLKTPAKKKVTCCCCHSDKQSADSEEHASKKLSRKTIAVRTTVQQLLGCQGKQELLKKQIVYILATAHQPTPEPFWQSLPVVSESVINLAIAPPVPHC